MMAMQLLARTQLYDSEVCARWWPGVLLAKSLRAMQAPCKNCCGTLAQITHLRPCMLQAACLCGLLMAFACAILLVAALARLAVRAGPEQGTS